MPNDKELKELEAEMRDPLSRWLVKPVQSSDTARLIRSLQPEFDGLLNKPRAFADRGERIKRPSLIRLMRAQLTSYPKSYWLASLAVFSMLTLVFSSGSNPSYEGIGGAFAFFMPVILLASMLYSFRTWNKGMRTIEGITPYPPALLLLCRVLLVIFLNIGFGLLCTIYLSQRVDQFPLLAFLVQWLSQMLLIGGLLAKLMLWKGFKPAIAGGMLMWVVFIGFEMAARSQGYPEAEWLLTSQIIAAAAGCMLLLLAYRRSLGMRLMD